MSWLDLLPWDAPIRLPRFVPPVIVPSLIRDSGQVLNLLMHHGLGDTVRDYSGVGNHGINYGARWIDGAFGWALNFNGAERVEVPHDESLNPRAHNLTVSYLVRTSSVVGSIRVLAKELWVTNFNGYFVMHTAAGKTLVFFGDGTNIAAVTGSPVNDGAWHHIDIVCVRGGLMTIYLDNLFDASVSIAAVTGDINPVTPLYVGVERSLTAYFFGDLALIRSYNRALTAAERTRKFERTRPIFVF